MHQEHSHWEVLKSDVLIIGGGFGGLWSALRAAEIGASVTLVDKSFAGKSGHSYFAGGAMMVLLPDDDLDEYVYDITIGNEWLVDQEMVAEVFKGSYDRLKNLESFGLPFRKSGGSYVWTKARGTRNVKNLWPEHATAADEVTILRKVALARDVKVVDHVYIYDLVKGADGGVAGAVGIGVKDPKNYLLHAKSVVIATNSGGFRGHHLACELQGTGPFMAYDAGARIKNPEFHYINIRPAKHEIEGSGILPAIGARWTNAEGVHYMETYDPVLKDRAPVSKIVVAAAKVGGLVEGVDDKRAALIVGPNAVAVALPLDPVRHVHVPDGPVDRLIGHGPAQVKRARLRDHHVYVGASLLQPAHQLRRLVRRDPARDAEQQPFVVEEPHVGVHITFSCSVEGVSSAGGWAASGSMRR